jgi:hypothetical protein
LTLFVAAALVPAPASAQEDAIVGRVLDTAGDPLPGVTVEVLGSAQRETRLEVTDLDGRYRIGDLPPGTYTVFFTLPGFRLVGRDNVGVDVGGGSVAPADAEMAIDDRAEVFLVSSDSPLQAGGAAAALECTFLPNGVIANCRRVTH